VLPRSPGPLQRLPANLVWRYAESKCSPNFNLWFDTVACRTALRGLHMRGIMTRLWPLAFCLASVAAVAQGDYQVVAVNDGGNISGTVKWSGPVPRELVVPINKDAQICDPDSRKTASLDRLIVGPDGGVANTVVYLKNIAAGKPMVLPEERRHLDQKHCRYIPHILLVPQDGVLSMESSDATLHTVHMDGAASFNLPFPFVDRTITRTMSRPGVVNLRCNGGHMWMNAELMVVSHPYYAVTDETGRFELTGVPPGTYQLVAWHEGWVLVGKEKAYDSLTDQTVLRPVFTEPKTWEKAVKVNPNESTVENFVISAK
jgi:Polysaccharide lyase family 4, domain II